MRGGEPGVEADLSYVEVGEERGVAGFESSSQVLGSCVSNHSAGITPGPHEGSNELVEEHSLGTSHLDVATLRVSRDDVRQDARQVRGRDWLDLYVGTCTEDEAGWSPEGPVSAS